MAKIVTLTFNPCIDKSTTIDALVADKKLRCSTPKFEPGGGGLNVARAVKKLGGEALAIYPAGGYSGKFLHQLVDKEGITSRIVEIKSHTRENLIVVDNSTNHQYRFGMPGPELEELHDGEGRTYGCEMYTIPGGEYIAKTIPDFMERIDEIGVTFQHLLAHPQFDGKTPCIEWYKNAHDVICMVKRK